MNQDAASKPKRHSRSTTALKLVCSLVGSALLATAHSQTSSAREQPTTPATAEQGNEQALQENLRQLIFNQGDFSKAKRIVDQARKTELNNNAQKETQQLFWITDACHAAGSADIPKKDMPSADEMNRYGTPGLECVDYREGFGVAQDYQAYRKCLLSRPYTLQENFPLAEIYAKGWGVPRNKKLATALICRENASELDLQIMLRELETSGDLTKSCEHGRTLGELFKCGNEERYIDRRRSEVKLEKIKTAMPSRDRASFEKVLSAYATFGETRRASEFDTMGQVGRFESFFEELDDKKSFVAAMELFESKKYPQSYGASAADEELNGLYQTITQSLKEDPIGSITFDGVRKTQRLWLIYRDRFVRFALAHYPGTKQEQWLAWLTQARIDQLRELQQRL